MKESQINQSEKLKKYKQEIRQQKDLISSLHEFHEKLATETDYHDLLFFYLEKTKYLFSCEKISLYFKDISKYPFDNEHLSDKYIFDISSKDGLVKEVISTKQIYNCKNIKKDKLASSSSNEHALHINSLLIFPIFDPQKNVVAVIKIFNKISGKFLKTDETLAQCLAPLYSVAFDKNKKQDEDNDDVQHKQEQQLAQADRMISLGTLSAGIAHEINNPNNYIKLNSEIMAKAWDDASFILDQYYNINGEFKLGGISYAKMRKKGKEIFNSIIKGSERITKIVQELKNYSRKDNVITKEYADINKIIKSSLALLINIIKKSVEGLKLSLGKDLPKIHCDYSKIEQVILNIVMNACQASRNQSSPIYIESSYNNIKNTINIHVKDSGCGISEENLKYIFDPFYTTKREIGGTGLGLAVSLNIIKAHKGELKINTKKGKGTTAILTLPIKAN